MTRVVYALELWPNHYSEVGTPLVILKDQKERFGHKLNIVRIEVIGL